MSGAAALVAQLAGVAFADGSVANIDLWRAGEAADEQDVFAAMVFVQDRSGRLAVVYSPRRGEWGSPGGWREEGERVPATAVREVREETGLEVTAEQLEPCGYEQFTVVSGAGRWPATGSGVLQAFRARLEQDAPPLRSSVEDATDPQWVDWAGFARRCAGSFWWPLAEAVLSPVPGTGPPAGPAPGRG